MRRFGMVALTLAAVLVAALSVGCASKKYVRETVGPVQKQVADLDSKTTAKDAELEKGVSRADERAQGADKRAGDAANAAANANTAAGRANDAAAAAGKQAGAAQTTADKGLAGATEAQRSVGTLGTKVENMDNYKLVTTESVLFGLGQSTLTKEAKAQLDAFAAKAVALKHFAIDVRGFTDTTGSAATNIALSQRRADAVVRYLTLDGKIPLFRVNIIGYGQESPAAANDTAAGRKQNRRVEVRLFTPNI